MQHAAWHATPRRQRRTARSIGSLRRTRLSDPRRSPAVQRLPGGAQLPDGRRFAAQHAAYVRRREGAGRRTRAPRLCHAAPFAAAALRCAALRCAALRCAALRCAAQRSGGSGNLHWCCTTAGRPAPDAAGPLRCMPCGVWTGALCAVLAGRPGPDAQGVRRRMCSQYRMPWLYVRAIDRFRPVPPCPHSVKLRATESQRATRAGPFALSCAGAARRGP
jgi:hypothetical protein